MKDLTNAVAFLCFGLIFAASTTGQNERRIRVETSLVSFNVAVTERQNNFIKGFSQEKFEVFDNGVRQQIAQFYHQKNPVAFGLVLYARAFDR
jgi:hypothetical protein